jgi:hypothetical protein
MNAPARLCPALALTALLTLAPGAVLAVSPAATPRAERLAARAAERALARESIASARAARAEARLAAVAPAAVVPLPRPATVRRMVRAGVPLNAPFNGARAAPLPQAVVMAPPASPSVVVESAPAQPAAAPAAAPAQTVTGNIRSAAATPTAGDDVAADGTRSVLATAEEPATAAAPREPAGPAITHPPIELLPTPAPTPQ